jgi:glycosyltransferase involved in cell wall biosynthesis
MRIVYFLPDIEAGVSRIVKSLLQYRPPAGDLQYAVVLFGAKGEQLPVADNDFNAGQVTRFNYKREENTRAVFKRMSKLLQSDNDIIVANDGFEVKMAAAMQLKNPVVFIIHGDFEYYYSIAKMYEPVISCYIAYSNKIEEELKKILPAGASKKVHKIYYPSASVANMPLLPPGRTNSIFKILFAGTLEERKGADILQAIYHQLVVKGMTDFELEIIGTGKLSNLLHEQFANHPNVLLSGWQPNDVVLKKMAVADLFLFPSTSEGLPNVLVEALSMGAVPVASDLESGVSDVVANGVNGVLVQAGNVNGFADAILGLFCDRERMHFLRGNARRGLSQFEPYKQAGVYEELIVKTAIEEGAATKVYPPYRKGRLLDEPWLPAPVVSLIRRLFSHPKL